MTCFPNQTKNERCACEPFVRCYNSFYSRNFSFQAIPDLMDRTQPQPDALYQEEQGGACLVIERKNLMHLTGSDVNQGYGRRHKNDHKIMDYLITNLRPEIAHGPYVLEMPFLHKVENDSYIVQHARDLCDFIHENFENLLQENRIEFYSEEPCCGEYALYRKDKSHWGELEDGPWGQFIIRMTGVGGCLPRFNWNKVGESDIPVMVAEVIRRASEKFRTYPDARKIILLERHGDIRGALHPGFEAVVRAATKPDTLDEIWDAWIETPDYDAPYWVYTRLWGKDTYLPQGWQRAEICCKTGCHCLHDLDPSDVFWFTDVKTDDK